MGALAVPIMIGAGIGGGAQLLRGKGLGGILQGAALGGAGGALTGGIGGAFGGGAAGGATSGAVNAAGAEVAKNAMAANIAAGIPGFTAGAAGAIPGTIEASGLVFNPSTGTYLNPEYYVGAGGPLATYTGGQGLLSNAMGNIGASIPSSIKDYATPQNLLGVAQLATESNKAPLQNIGSGQISRSQVPQYVPFNVGEVQTWKKRGQA